MIGDSITAAVGRPSRERCRLRAPSMSTSVEVRGALRRRLVNEQHSGGEGRIDSVQWSRGTKGLGAMSGGLRDIAGALAARQGCPPGVLNIESYWDIDQAAPDAPISSIIEDRIYLNGGIDSAAVADTSMQLLKERDPNAKLATFTLAFPGEEPSARRLTRLIQIDGCRGQRRGSDCGVQGWNIRPIVLTAVIRIFYRGKDGLELGYPVTAGKIRKVVLSGEGADEFFGGYAWFLVDYLRANDPAGLTLGLDLSSYAERQEILNKMLGGVSAHCPYTAATIAGPEVFNETALGVTGGPDITRAIAEGTSVRAREKATSGQWHPLNVASVRLQAFLHLELYGRAHGDGTLWDARPPFWTILSLTTSTLFLRKRIFRRKYTITDHQIRENQTGQGQQPWAFTDKWILRQVVKPYVAKELFLRKKLSYSAPPSRRGMGASGLVTSESPNHLRKRGEIGVL
ncbi:hypothetical protein B0H17DRAFT_1186976 [Mycena rosella]|uniref:Asparagine synthetase domain-containing protein n=1 Tax=Mycena rosella TaxID=1033263 RepID=A0AAD7CCK8_MYCRO|nr:hypothetical protein B0H17DRAFT_1186976 [Mycena rosella]